MSTVLFALLHVGPWMLLVAGVAGLALGILRFATGSVAAGIGLHAGLNLAGLLYGAPALRHPLHPPVACLAGGAVLAVLVWSVRGRSRRDEGELDGA